jgi:sulfur carrier protein ThiS
MGRTSTTKRRIEVTVLRPDGPSQTFTLPGRATLADLLREAGAGIRGPNILIDGRPIEEATILKSGMTITIVPEPPQPPPNGSWRDTVGMFEDNAAFREMIAAGRAIREADREAARKEAEQDD